MCFLWSLVLCVLHWLESFWSPRTTLHFKKTPLQPRGFLDPGQHLGLEQRKWGFRSSDVWGKPCCGQCQGQGEPRASARWPRHLCSINSAQAPGTDGGEGESGRERGQGAGTFVTCPAPRGRNERADIHLLGPYSLPGREMHLHKLSSRNHQGERASPAWNLSSQPREWRIFQM